jgi:hypothetical protein
MLKTLYGYTPTPHSMDPLVRLINTVMAELSASLVAGAWLVDLIPWLRHLPDWAPGMGFKQTARRWRKNSKEVQRVPLDFVAEQMASHSARPSYVQGLLGQDPDPAERELIMLSATALYAGGADTTVAALSFFLLAMAVFPEVQVKAREEIDRVVGSGGGGGGAGRLPNFGDRDNLPYVEALVSETLRWRPLAPLCIPHGTLEEGEFRGYRIPKGSVILPSIAWFAADPNVYRDPDEFRPGRFLFITIARTLAVFDIGKPVDKETGMVVEPVVAMKPGIVAHPAPFRLSIVPRSEKHAVLVRNIGIEHPWEEGDAVLLKGLSEPNPAPVSH